MTPIFENFRQSLERTTASGDTAIYDALDSARRVLTQYRPDLPNLRKRIVIVSDGEDTSSGTSAREVALALQRARIVVDSVQVGRRTDTILHAISVATGTTSSTWFQ
jgi:Mg-chelatase subunit ChlD